MAFIKYEYKIIQDAPGSQFTEENLNNQGQDGWKLLTVHQKLNGNYDIVFIRE